MAKWKRRLLAIEEAEHDAATRAREERVNALRAALWKAETAVLAHRHGAQQPCPALLITLEANERSARDALRAALS